MLQKTFSWIYPKFAIHKWPLYDQFQLVQDLLGEIFTTAV